MELAFAGPFAPLVGFFEVPEPASAPEVALTMSAGADRSAIARALASVGWSVTLIDDGWSLLDHLGAGLMSRRAPAPALGVIEIAVAGPRLRELFRSIRASNPAMPVLLVGAGDCTPDETVLRPPFYSQRVLAAVRRVAGTRS